MSLLSSITEFTDENPWAVEVAAAVVCLAIGVALMPAAIFYTGAAALGKYEGASVGNLYSSVFSGIGAGSAAAWVVVLGPYGLYLLFKVLRLWWRAGAVREQP
jgi:hypothetical protein